MMRLISCSTAALCTLAATAASASALNAHGQLLHLAPGARANANQSENWFGYNQGTLEQGRKLFHSITARWTVPTASQHTKGQAEYSSDWIGIGGGCVDANCLIGDTTLIQTGTEHVGVAERCVGDQVRALQLHLALVARHVDDSRRLSRGGRA